MCAGFMRGGLMYGGLIFLRIRGPLVIQHESVVFLQFRCGNYAIFPEKCGIFAICRRISLCIPLIRWQVTITIMTETSLSIYSSRSVGDESASLEGEDLTEIYKILTWVYHLHYQGIQYQKHYFPWACFKVDKIEREPAAKVKLPQSLDTTCCPIPHSPYRLFLPP